MNAQCYFLRISHIYLLSNRVENLDLDKTSSGSTSDFCNNIRVFIYRERKFSEISSFSFPFIDLEIPLSSNLTLDLDLKVFDGGGNLVGYSGSWDNSYEIAEFEGVPGETYTIRIRRWSGTESTWYGIAWTVTGGFLLPELVLRKGLRLADLNL